MHLWACEEGMGISMPREEDNGPSLAQKDTESEFSVMIMLFPCHMKYFSVP